MTASTDDMIASTEPVQSFKAPKTRSPYSAPFWDGLRRQALVVQRCEECGHISHPPGPICKNCMSDKLGWTELSGEGEVYSYTVTHRAMHPEFEADAPYVIAWVRLDGGPTIVSWLREVDTSDDLIGIRVKAVYERIDDDVVLHRFVPVQATT